ncbi:5-oxoprolinase subunit PxpB [Thalassomonas actiniarum]|uniref:5-oxoprolinase subunit PxpB n=1 Tax=Thalassomonas actiniarum TaxID=485447 RepID=A0AAE9YQ01_9GAMM|nr:5-oxoprolinase subunit PxpB [Thalassomonas actiniarum]WDD98701.1 5-oxoprolinase subunit PxpB [Thalassomonas actiniarum]
MTEKNSRLAPFTVSQEAVSENAVLLSWPEKICPKQHQHIIACRDAIHRQLAGLIIDSVASYNTLMVYYHFQLTDSQPLINRLRQIIEQSRENELAKGNNTVLEIPVYYGEQAGWDLSSVAEQTGLPPDEVIALHQASSYRAYALGFTPGFCYLGSLPPQLQLPRRSNPRANVPKGAVAIAGLQTAVYPNASPGGWHILGQTPLAMYSITTQEFHPLLTPGQLVRFKAINAKTFKEMSGELVREGQ